MSRALLLLLLLWACTPEFAEVECLQSRECAPGQACVNRRCQDVFDVGTDAGRGDGAADGAADGDGVGADAGTCAAPLDEGLVGYWRFDEGRGRLAADASGNGFDGIIEGATWVDDAAPTPGGDGKALNFNGFGDHVDLGDPPSLRFRGSSMSVSAWFKSPASLDRKYPTLLGKWWSGNTQHEAAWAIYWNEQGLHFDLQDNATHSLSAAGGAGLGDGAWHHVVGSYDHDGREIRVYVDGVLTDRQVDATFRGLDDIDRPTFIGGSSRDSVGDEFVTYFAGLIDEVRLYQRPLDPCAAKLLARRAR